MSHHGRLHIVRIFGSDSAHARQYRVTYTARTFGDKWPPRQDVTGDPVLLSLLRAAGFDVDRARYLVTEASYRPDALNVPEEVTMTTEQLQELAFRM